MVEEATTEEQGLAGDFEEVVILLVAVLDLQEKRKHLIPLILMILAMYLSVQQLIIFIF